MHRKNLCYKISVFFHESVAADMSTESKCWCFSLRTGVVLIALLDILIALVIISFSSIRLVGNDYEFNEGSIVAYKSVDIISIILYTLLAFTATILIIGAARKHPRSLKPWMITKLFLIVFGGILQIAYLSFVTTEFHTKAAKFVMLMEGATIIQIGKTGFLVDSFFVFFLKRNGIFSSGKLHDLGCKQLLQCFDEAQRRD